MFTYFCSRQWRAEGHSEDGWLGDGWLSDVRLPVLHLKASRMQLNLSGNGTKIIIRDEHGLKEEKGRAWSNMPFSI